MRNVSCHSDFVFLLFCFPLGSSGFNKEPSRWDNSDLLAASNGVSRCKWSSNTVCRPLGFAYKGQGHGCVWLMSLWAWIAACSSSSPGGNTFIDVWWSCFPMARIHAPVFDLVTSLATTDLSEERGARRKRRRSGQPQMKSDSCLIRLDGFEQGEGPRAQLETERSRISCTCSRRATS